MKPVFIETGLARSLKPVSDDTETGFVQLVKPVSEAEKRPNTEPQGVPEALDRFLGKLIQKQQNRFQKQQNRFQTTSKV